MSEYKVGDKVIIKKDRASAVVSNAVNREGRKQIQVECKRDDNGSVHSYWVDEIQKA